MSKIFFILLLCGCVQVRGGVVIGKQYAGDYRVLTDNGNYTTSRDAFDTLKLGDSVYFYAPRSIDRIGPHPNRGYFAERGLIPPLASLVD